MRAWAMTSPSEWPARPGSPGKSTPREHERDPVGEAVRVDSQSRCGARSSERLLACLAPIEHRDGVVARLAGVLDRSVEVPSDVRGDVGVGGERDRNAFGSAAASNAGSGRASREACRGRWSRLRWRLRRASLRPPSQSQSISGPNICTRSGWASASKSPLRAAGRAPRSSGATPPRPRRRRPGVGSPSIAMAVEKVDRAEQVVPRVGASSSAVSPRARLVVDLEPELDRIAAPLRLDDGVDVRIEVVGAALEVVRNRPQRPCLLEVVDVLA